MTKLHRQSPDDFQFAREGTSEAAPSERERQMAEFRIECDGLRFHYNGYRYDKLADAVAYASLMRARPEQHDAGGPSPRGATFTSPTDDERTLMASLGIGHAAGAYRFGDFRYERLSDAVNYAKLVRQRPADERD